MREIDIWQKTVELESDRKSLTVVMQVELTAEYETRGALHAGNVVCYDAEVDAVYDCDVTLDGVSIKNKLSPGLIAHANEIAEDMAYNRQGWHYVDTRREA